MKVGALLAKFAGKAGLNVSDPKYADLLAIATEIPDEDANKISASLITIDDAKQNLDIKKYFTSQVLDGTDAELNKIMDEMGLEVADKDELKAEKNTYQRIGKLTKKISDLEKKKAGATTGEKKELQEQINSLTSKISEINTAHAANIKAINEKHNSEMTDIASRQIFSGIKTIYDELPQTAKIAALEAVVKEELRAAEAMLIRNGNIIELKQVKDTSLDWYDKTTNEKLTYEQFVNGILAKNKILAVNNQAAAGAGQNGNNGTGNVYQPPIIQGGNGGNANQELLNAFAESQKQLNDALTYQK